MVANRTLVIRITRELYNQLKEDSKREGYLQISPYIRKIIMKNEG
jgi:hypothetical protein